eukprot:scaffold587_cov339-Pavlova_lutheri.AAC.54
MTRRNYDEEGRLASQMFSDVVALGKPHKFVWDVQYVAQFVHAHAHDSHALRAKQGIRPLEQMKMHMLTAL